MCILFSLLRVCVINYGFVFFNFLLIEKPTHPFFFHYFYSDKLRASRSAISEADIKNEFTLGVPGEAFSFSHCYNKVTVAEASGLTGEIAQVEQFIREYVRP